MAHGSSGITGAYGFEDSSLKFFLDNYILHPNKLSTNGWKQKVLKPSATFESQVTAQNTIYVIKYDYSLSRNFTLPSGSVLVFEGGSIKGGTSTSYTLIGNNTAIVAAPNFVIFGYRLLLAGTWRLDKVWANWFYAATDDAMFDRACSLAALAVTLSSTYPLNAVRVTCLTRDYTITDTITIPEGVSFDGNYARFLCDDDIESETFMFLTGYSTGSSSGRYPYNRHVELCNLTFYNTLSNTPWSMLAMGDVREVHSIYAYRPKRLIMGRGENQNIYQDVVNIHDITYVPNNDYSYNRTSEANALATAAISFSLGECLKISQISDGCSLYISSKSNAMVENCTNISVYNDNCQVVFNNCHFERGDLDLYGTAVFNECMFFHGHNIDGNAYVLNIRIDKPGIEAHNYNQRTYKNTFNDCIFAETTRAESIGGTSDATNRFKFMEANGSLVFNNCFGLMSHSGSINDSPACMIKAGDFWVNPKRFELNNGIVLEDSKSFVKDISIGEPSENLKGSSTGKFRLLLLVDADKQLYIEPNDGYKFNKTYNLPSVITMFHGYLCLSRYKGVILRVEAKLNSSSDWTHYVDVGIVENPSWFFITYSGGNFYFRNWTTDDWTGTLSIDDDYCLFKEIQGAYNPSAYTAVSSYVKSGNTISMVLTKDTHSLSAAAFNLGDKMTLVDGQTYVCNLDENNSSHTWTEIY